MPILHYGKKKITVNRGVLLKDCIENLKITPNGPVVAGLIDNSMCSLNTAINRNVKFEPVFLNSVHGLKIYERSINLILTLVGKELFPEDLLHLKFSLNKGVYGEFEVHKPISKENLDKISAHFDKLINEDLQICMREFGKKKAIQLFKKQNDSQKINLVTFFGENKIPLWCLKEYWAYFTGPLLPSTGYLNAFELSAYEDGFVVRFPDLIAANELPPYENQRKIFHVYSQFSRWLDLLEIKDSGNVNEMIEDGRFSDFLKMNEAIQEKEISDIADTICNSSPKPHLVLISGPSSSGKTTFSKRLGIQLRVNGVKPLLISLDNYYLDRDQQIEDENGNVDLEALQALDLKKFNADILKLLNGKTTLLPIFSFIQGKRLPGGKKTIFKNDQVIVVEGIHGLNPELTRQIPSQEKFRIYVSPLTQVPIDNSNRFPTADNRLIRRIVRDAKFRGYPPEKTISAWPSVREGEEHNIFPFQENADVLFNSALMYELNIFHPLIYSQLAKISRFEREYANAQYLLELLRYYKPYKIDEIPPTSILREFIGDSSFHY